MKGRLVRYRWKAYALMTTLYVLCNAAGFAQSPYFQTHAALDGLRVSLIFEDSRGFVWLGTRDGLKHYDGNTLQTYLMPDSLGAVSVTAIYEDRDGVLWIGYENGSIGTLRLQEVKPYLPEEGTPIVRISGIWQDPQGLMWFATYGEGLYFQRAGRLYNIDQEDGLSDTDIYTLAGDEKGRVWVGTDGGISICWLEAGEKQVRNIGVGEGLPDNIVRELQVDMAGNMWIGMYDHGICVYDMKSDTFRIPISADSWTYGPVSTILPMKGKAWVGTEGGGLLTVGEGVRQLTGKGDVQVAPNGKILDLLRDGEGNIWLSSNTNGLVFAQESLLFLDQINSEPIGNVQAILADRQGHIWYSTETSFRMLNKSPSGALQRGNSPSLDRLQGENIISMYEDAAGYLWLGTFGNGVFRYLPLEGTLHHYTEAEGLINENVLSIKGNGPEIWFATLGGVSRCRLPDAADPGGFPLEMESFRREDGLGINYIYYVHTDKSGKTWFGTDGKGIAALENGQFHHYADTALFKSNKVYSIAEDDQGGIWFSTADVGIYRLLGDSVRYLGLEGGLSNLAISALVNDGNGHMLAIHSKGFDLISVASGLVNSYEETAGFEEVDAALNAVSIDQQGSIWMGTQQGIVRYVPPDLPFRMRPATRIEQTLMLLNPVPLSEGRHFAYDENDLTFDYVGLWYRAPGKVHYQYRLSGHNTEWITSQDRRATYPNLPPGEYVFQLRATANDNFDHAPMSSVAFHIRPPFWQEVWFLLAVGIGLLLFLYWIIRDREKRLEKAASLKQQMIEFQFDTLKNQVNPHFLFNSFNTLISIIEEEPKIAVGYVEKLADFFRNMLEYRDQQLIPLEEELELLNTFLFLQKKRYGENLQLTYEITAAQPGACIPPLTLQMLIENAIKHNVISARKPLLIHISINGDSTLRVQNNLQKKRGVVPSTGTGLQNIRSRFELLGRDTMRVRETETEFIVDIPLLNSIT